MKTLNLIEQDWVLYIASYWELVEVTDEQYENITSWKYLVSYDDNNNFVFNENPAYKEMEKQRLQNQLEQLDNKLAILNWKIKGWEELIEMWVADEDDLKQVEEMKLKASEMINKRIEIKKQIKELSFNKQLWV